MSEKPNIIKTFDTALSRIDEAVAKILEAQQLNATMQRKHELGSTAWHEHETVDDKLHDALASLGQ